MFYIVNVCTALDSFLLNIVDIAEGKPVAQGNCALCFLNI